MTCSCNFKITRSCVSILKQNYSEDAGKRCNTTSSLLLFFDLKWINIPTQYENGTMSLSLLSDTCNFMFGVKLYIKNFPRQSKLQDSLGTICYIVKQNTRLNLLCILQMLGLKAPVQENRKVFQEDLLLRLEPIPVALPGLERHILNDKCSSL